MKAPRSTHGFTLLELLAVIVIIAIIAVMASAGMSKMSANRDALQCVNNLRQIGVASQMYINDNNGRYPISRLQYTMDKNGARKTVSFLPDLLNSYLKLPNVEQLWWCPGDKERPANMRKYSYGHNQYLGGNLGSPTEWNGEPNPSYDPRYAFIQALPKPASQVIFLADYVDYGDAGKWSSSLGGSRWPLPKNSTFNSPTPARFDFSRHLNRAHGLFLDGSVRNLTFDSIAGTERLHIFPE